MYTRGVKMEIVIKNDCFEDIKTEKKYTTGIINYIIKGYKMPNRDAFYICKDIINKRGTDIYKLQRIVTKLGTQVSYIARPQERAATVSALLNGKPVQTYLDYGCGDGSITQYIGEMCGAKTYGVDIINCSNKNVNQVETIQIDDSSIDLVTAFVSLHHVEDSLLPSVLSEIYRILQPGGMLIIREHDFDGTDSMFAYLQLIHMFSIVRDSLDSLANELVSLQSTHYRSRIAWTMILSDYGFELQKIIGYDCNNTQGLYHASYIKTCKI